MAWKNYSVWNSGTVAIIDGNSASRDARFEIGVIETGRQRVFHRFYLRLTLPDGETILGEDPYNVYTAVLDANEQLEARNSQMIAAGVEPGFYESGLSHNSGYGYLPGFDVAIHMMDMPPSGHRDNDEGDAFVEGLIRDAVDGMFKTTATNAERPTSH